GAGRAQGQPLQHQDQAALPAQSAQRHHDLGRARPLGQAARVGERAQDGRSSRRSRCIPIEGEGQRPLRESARVEAADQKEKSGGSGVSRPRKWAVFAVVSRLDYGSTRANWSSSGGRTTEKLSFDIN